MRVFKYGPGGMVQESMRLLDASGTVVARTPVEGEFIDDTDNSWGFIVPVVVGETYTLEIAVGTTSFNGQVETY